MVDFYATEGGRQVRVGAKLERWLGGRQADWGEVTNLFPGRRIPVSQAGSADILIHDVEDVVDLIVDGWAAEARARRCRQTKGACDRHDGTAKPAGDS